METRELIEKLSQEAGIKKPSRAPVWWIVRLVLVLVVYGAGVQFFLGIRPHILVQFERFWFTLEIALLAGLIASATFASVFAMYPDLYQKPWVARIPYLLFAALILLVFYQLVFTPDDPRMVIPAPGGHAMECALCIGAVALTPSALIFGLLRKGASVTPLSAGFLALLTSTGIGSLTLRLAEENDSLMHLATWHYLPTLIFAALGVIAGRVLLKW